ncbi:MLX-interacting protein isoform X4 [Lingula anatina]|uniref:MLX-interacting protein isoform X4 n=2 Tax=Lingula anatina TaxID=7574 RepID=A0A1S3HSU1_LINAN|nr:MLX-interacting protein isoform X4 [Lingula anatina]|eukprot:XP_013388124.1 MLX-interacting protein isoform X4 [Lingula anatina]
MFLHEAPLTPIAMAKSDIFDTDSSDEDQKKIDDWEESDNDKFIHSGHFMLSRVHGYDDEKTISDQPVPPVSKASGGYDFATASREPQQTYNFGDGTLHGICFTIDDSFTKLFECMTLAYSGKLCSPKFKNFRGLKLRLKDKLRLNNIIWREWHMQYVKGQFPVVCQFATPVSDDTHIRPEAVVLEGKYWKRKLEVVTAEYKKWRVFYKHRLKCRPPTSDIHLPSHADLLQRVAEQDSFRFANTLQPPRSPQMNDDDFYMDFTDTLFSSLNMPFAFPNPKEMGLLGNADFIQPGLIQLQPALEDFMDTLEPLQDIITSLHKPMSSPNLTTSQSPLPTIDMNSAAGVLRNQMFSQPVPEGDGMPMTDDMSLLTALEQTSQTLNQQQQLQLQDQGLSLTGNVTILTPSFSQQQQQRDIGLDNVGVNLQLQYDNQAAANLQQIQTVASQNDSTKAKVNYRTTNLQNDLDSSLPISVHPERLSQQQQVQQQQQQQTQQQPLRSFLVKLNDTQPTGKLPINKIQTRVVQKPPVSAQSILNSQKPAKTKKASATVTFASQQHQKPQQQPVAKKDGDFVVPKGKPTFNRAKPRTIVPAPTVPPAATIAMTTQPSGTSITQQNTFLAQLLTTGDISGTYPGANITMKTETPASCGGKMFTPIRPAPPVSTTAVTTNSMSMIAAVASLENSSMSSPLSLQKNPLLGTVTSLPGSSLSSGDYTALSNSPEYKYNADSPPGYLTASASPDSDVPSPGKAFRPKNEDERQQYKEHRRVSHISAEQKRRGNIKGGFDVLHTLIPALIQNPNAKISKAQMLQKTAEYCKKLKSDRKQMQDEAEILRQEIESLNSAINTCQSQLPATGAPVTRQRADQMREMFDEYVRSRTLQNWKFWIFSTIIRPLFDSYNNMVSTASAEELCRTVLAWLDQHCSLVALRPGVLNSLRQLSTSTSILSDPSRVPEQAQAAVGKKPG